ncbi:hypothetical protein [Streptosporangium vulgare]
MTRLPAARSAIPTPSMEPSASPSGETWQASAISSAAEMSSTARAQS